MSDREVRYCTAEDGVRIAYCVEGEGPPLIVVPWGLPSFSLAHLLPAVERFVAELGRGRQLIQADIRGTGLSERDVTDVSFERLLGDLECLINTLELPRFSIFTMTNGAAGAVALAARHPGLVERIVLYASFARAVPQSFVDQTRALAQFARTNWELASRAFADMEVRRKSDELGLRFAEWLQQSVTGEVAARFIEASIESDVTALLPEVQCPTLVIHRRDDSRYGDGQQVAASIKGARFITIEGEGGLAVGDWEPIVEAIGDFLPRREGVPAYAPSSGWTFRTVLFTDIVGHTEMMSRLGDERGRDVLREHERITREVLKARGGTEVKTMGDGFMASFGSVTRAVECAVALQRAFEERNQQTNKPTNLSVRVGLNAGEPIEEDGDLFGATVILAARIAARAEGGEILVADTVRGLCSGKGFLFADRGEFVAKGFEEPVRVYEVRWRE